MDRQTYEHISDLLTNADEGKDWRLSVGYLIQAINTLLPDESDLSPAHPAPQPPAATPVCPLCGTRLEWDEYRNRLCCGKDDCELFAIEFVGSDEETALALFARITGQGVTK